MVPDARDETIIRTPFRPSPRSSGGTLASSSGGTSKSTAAASVATFKGSRLRLNRPYELDRSDVEIQTIRSGDAPRSPDQDDPRCPPRDGPPDAYRSSDRRDPLPTHEARALRPPARRPVGRPQPWLLRNRPILDTPRRLHRS